MGFCLFCWSQLHSTRLDPICNILRLGKWLFVEGLKIQIILLIPEHFYVQLKVNFVGWSAYSAKFLSVTIYMISSSIYSNTKMQCFLSRTRLPSFLWIVYHIHFYLGWKLSNKHRVFGKKRENFDPWMLEMISPSNILHFHGYRGCNTGRLYRELSEVRTEVKRDVTWVL